MGSLFVLLLIVANGVFSMSETAVVSARRARLQQRAGDGDERARRALGLSEAPNIFLATVQVGITLIGILSGAFGGATIAGGLAARLEGIPALAPYADTLALGLVVLVITYLSLVVGELVPKRIALNNPEGISSLVAGPMSGLSRLTAPVVHILGTSTDAVLRLLRVRQSQEPPVTDEEIGVLLEQGARAGVFHPEERELVERVFDFADDRLGDGAIALLALIPAAVLGSLLFFSGVELALSSRPQAYGGADIFTVLVIGSIAAASDPAVAFAAGLPLAYAVRRGLVKL